MHSESSVDHSFKRPSKGIRSATVCRDSDFRHTFSAERWLARPKSELFKFHQEEAATHRSVTTPIGPAKRPKDEAQGLHKTSIYNILAKAGSNRPTQEKRNRPYRVGYCTATRMQSDGNMPESFRDERTNTG
jgi:hypothetical protein